MAAVICRSASYRASGADNRLTCASNCLLLGDADANTTRLPLTMFNAGRSNGSGIRGRGGALLAGDGCDASYDGGGSSGVFSSAIVQIAMRVCTQRPVVKQKLEDEVADERGKVQVT